MDIDVSHEEKPDELAQKVIDTLALSGNCAQTSFAVLQKEFDLEGRDILKALTAFPGIALRGETCGAVVGCLMAIGSVYGRDELDDWQGFIGSVQPSRKFCRQFEEVHSSTTCANLLESKLGRNFNLADPNESMQYVTAGGPQACGEIIVSAVEIAAEIIQEKE